MQRVIALFRKELVCLYHGDNVRTFNRQYNVVKIELFQLLRRQKRALAKRFRRRRAVFGKQILLKRTAVDADSDWNILFPANIGDHFYSVVAADVAGVDAYFGDTGFRRFYRKAVVEVNIGDQRKIRVLTEKGNAPDRVRTVDRKANNVAARFLEPLYLRKASLLCRKWACLSWTATAIGLSPRDSDVSYFYYAQIYALSIYYNPFR
jgi:hypothetical protein